MSAAVQLAAPTHSPMRALDGTAPATSGLTLRNGLRVVLAEDRTVPIVFLSWTADAGFERDPLGLEGLASMTPLLFREGTARRGGDRITHELDDLGATVSVGSDWDAAFVTVALLSGDLAAGVDLLLDMSCAPTFSPSAVVRIRPRRLAEIERRRRDPRALAHDAFARALFGDASYGRASLGTTASVQRIDAADIGAFHDAHYRPETSYVGVAGSFDPDRIVDLLEAFDPPSRGCTTAKPPQLAPAVDPGGGVVLLDAPHAPHTEIRVGHLGVTRDCEDLPALDVLNAVLGGGPGSRLARSVRGHHGLAYHIRSRFIARRVGGMFSVETSVAHNAAATTLTAIRQEIERLRDELVPASEIEQARRRASGAALRFSQDLISAGVGLGPAALRKDSDYLQRRTHRVAHVEPTMLRELARRYLHPERLAAVLVGPAAALQSQFSSAVAHSCPAFESTS